MAIRNLHRQARPFRILGWSLFAASVLCLPDGSLPTQRFAGAMVLALVGVVALDGLRLFDRSRETVPDHIVYALQRIELLLVPGLMVALQLPLALLIATLGALVNANVALGGGRSFWLAMGCAALSLSLAWLFNFVAPTFAAPTLAPGEQVWLVGALMVLVFTIALAEVGFCVTQKLDDHRRQWQDRLAVLRPFVPPALTQPPLQQERRWITVVMVDLVEFTRRSTPLPPEVVGRVLDDLLDAVVAGANQSGGTLDKFMGDGALLFFSGELDRARAARDALRFSQVLLAELPRLNRIWLGFGTREHLQLRLGIASGYCSIGQWGTSEVRAYTMVGACVGLAERLQGVSRPNSLSLCAVSARLLYSAESPTELPIQLKVDVGPGPISLQASQQDLKGFARMRVYRPSAKVHAPPV